MELIERYISEVGRRLPTKNREDILKELRSLILDKLEERVPEGQPAHNDVVEVLKSMGSPKKVAESYAGEQYLIGPANYPRMMQIARIVLLALVVLPVLGLFEALNTDFASMSAAVEYGMNEVAEYLNTAVAAFGMIVLTFAILERQEVQLPEQEEKWDPESLPAVNQPGRVSYFDMGFEMAFNMVSFALLSYFLQQGGIPIFFAEGGADTILPIRAEVFIALMIITIVQIVLHLFVMQRGRWQLSTRLADAGLDLISLYYAFGIVQEVVLHIDEYLPALREFDVPSWPVSTIYGIVVLCLMLSHAVNIYRLYYPMPIAKQMKETFAKG